jgi:glycogen debranching enzyme
VGPSGYLPYHIGPVIEETGPTTAGAPLFSFEAWEIAGLGGDEADPGFVADAYAAGQKIHAFWVAERDLDHDGLAEWGSVTESVRDQDDVIWSEVAPPGAVDALDLNCMLVMEEKSLAQMAAALGLPAEATAWQGVAADRAARINALMWDEASGFYYDVSLATHTFTYAKQGDLERMEIAGILPLWAGIAPADRRARLVARIQDPAVFLRPFGVASLAATDPFYAPAAAGPDRWNGPVQLPWQWLVARGLRASGEAALADEITLRVRAAVSAELSRSHVFRELYDPDGTAPANGSSPNYLWGSMTALMALEAGAH